MVHPLWSTHDQTGRLAELTASTSDAAKELPLRRDVRSLGKLLGRVLVEQEGEHLLEVVEELRRLLIKHREQWESDSSDGGQMAKAIKIVKALDVEDAHRVTKAFAIYFELTNLAETNHRKRRRRAGKLQSDQPSLIAGSFRGTLRRLQAAGLNAKDALAALQKTRVIPVITAHPTEVARRTVLLKRRRIARFLENLDHLPLSSPDAQEQEFQRSLRRSQPYGRPMKFASKARWSPTRSAWGWISTRCLYSPACRVFTRKLPKLSTRSMASRSTNWICRS